MLKLNRAVARAEVSGARAALAELGALERDKRVLSYQPYWAVKGQLRARAGDIAAAAEALNVALGLTTDEAVKAYLSCLLALTNDDRQSGQRK
jgi:RNA polymerase sigma-70 factor (ECF subfamily)